MSWYFQHQRAREIIAEHQRQADRIRLARLFAEGQRAEVGHAPGHSLIRRAIGGGVVALGRALTRVGHAVDGAEASPSA